MKSAFSKIYFLLTLFAVVLFAGCQTTGIEPKTSPFQVFSGETESKTATWHCVKIDLDYPDLEVLLIPDNENYKSAFVKDVARAYGAKVAINTTPFDLDNKDRLVGITKAQGKEITAPVAQYAALCFTENPLRAYIINSQTQEALEPFSFASGGFYTVLQQGEIISFKHNRRSRSAAGISDNGRFLYLFATTPKFNLRDYDGLTYEECAKLLSDLGCSDAMQFDGGHSTGLYFEGKELEKPFMQRKVPALLIIK